MNTQQDKENYAELDVNQFANGTFPWKALIATPCGRKHLLRMRTAEKFASNNIANAINSNPHCILSSLVYSNLLQVIYVINKTSHMRKENEPILVLTEAIAEIEWLFKEKCHGMLSREKRLFEETRINDLILLTEILKNDNADDLRASVYELPERLEHTHKGWPPEDNEVFSPISGYTVIQKALKVRKERNIDALDSVIQEKWTHEILPSENAAKKTE